MTDMTIDRPISGSAEGSHSAVSWAAIIAGGLTAAALSLVLLILGAGLGLTSVSPWSGASASAAALGVGAAIWLIVTQWISAGVGGYLTGRLRTKWVSVHTDEVFFRDTAHGFLSWALATVISAGLLASALSAIVGGAATAASTVMSGAAQGAVQGATQAAGGSSPTDYFVDLLFRPATPPAAGAPAPAATPQESRAEAGRILVLGLANGDISAPDRTYLAEVIAAQTGLAQPDAEKRVNDVIAGAKAAADKARQAADAARKAASALAFFSFFSLLIGAFVASAAAALGGRERDLPETPYAAR